MPSLPWQARDGRICALLTLDNNESSPLYVAALRRNSANSVLSEQLTVVAGTDTVAPHRGNYPMAPTGESRAFCAA
jgi:hypothetical protein